MAIAAGGREEAALSDGDVWRNPLAVREVCGGGIGTGHPDKVGPTIWIIKRRTQF